GRVRGHPDPAEVQGAAGHHRQPRYGRTVRGGQAHGEPGSPDRAVPVTEHAGRGDVHRYPRVDGAADRDDRGVRQDQQGRVRPLPGAGVPGHRWPGGPGEEVPRADQEVRLEVTEGRTKYTRPTWPVSHEELQWRR